VIPTHCVKACWSGRLRFEQLEKMPLARAAHNDTHNTPERKFAKLLPIGGAYCFKVPSYSTFMPMLLKSPIRMREQPNE
jgi:hypothetical protein